MNFKNFFKSIFFITVSFLIFSCGSETGGGTETEIRSYNDVKLDFEKLTFTPGINDIEIIGTADYVWKFRLIVPANASVSNKRPLIVSLHGGATIANSGFYKATSCLVEPGFESLDAYILSPASDGFPWFDEPNQYKVVELTRLVKEFLNVDSNKVAISGYSDGGIGAWFHAQYNPSDYSASIPMSAQYNPRSPSLGTSKINIPMYAIHGENDELFPLETTQQFVDLTIDAGTDITFVIATGLTHNNTCDYESYLKDAAIWLDTVVWK